jgi:hypothetical protein
MTGRCHCHCHYHFGGSAGISRGCHGGRAQGCRVPGSSALLRGASKRSSASHGLSIMTVERRPTRMLHRGRLGASRLQGQDALVSWSGLGCTQQSVRRTSLCRAWPRPRSRFSARRRGTDWTAGQGSLRPYSSCMRWLLADRRGCDALIRGAARQPSRRRRANAALDGLQHHRDLFVRGHDGRPASRNAQSAMQRGEAADVRREGATGQAGRGDEAEETGPATRALERVSGLHAARWNTHSERPANRVVVRTAPWIRMALVFLAVGLPGPPERNSAPLALAPLCC